MRIACRSSRRGSNPSTISAGVGRASIRRTILKPPLISEKGPRPDGEEGILCGLSVEVVKHPDAHTKETIQYARVGEGIVVIHVAGRGSHHSSVALRQVMNVTSEGGRTARYVFDLQDCPTMDSTFMGVVACIALRQKETTGVKAVVTNLQPRVRDQLDLLGLKFILEMRQAMESGGPAVEIEDATFKTVVSPRISKLERTIHMIEAHERLIDVDDGNEVKFRRVLDALRESLDRQSDTE